mmetsp:Transcript_16339/g.48667  ORF Transcript_16339/g.48667 Transcript_16339/m.48667 type:complete len:631 (+) Transcript_16339:439-2331(+)
MSTLAALPSLRHLRLAGNPVGASSRYRMIVAAVLPQLLTLDGEPLEDGTLLAGHRSHGRGTLARAGSVPGPSREPDEGESMSAWLDAEGLAGDAAAGSSVGGVRSTRSAEPIPLHGLEGVKLNELAASVPPRPNMSQMRDGPQKRDTFTGQQELDASHTSARPVRWSPSPSRIPHAPARSAPLQWEKQPGPLSQRGRSGPPVMPLPQVVSQGAHARHVSTAAEATHASGSTHTGTHSATSDATPGAFLGQPTWPSTAARSAGLPEAQQRVGWARQRDSQDQLAWLAQQVGDQQSRINGVEATLRGPAHASVRPVSGPALDTAHPAGTHCASAGGDVGAAASAPARNSAAWCGMGSDDDADARSAGPPRRTQPTESPTELQVLADSVRMLRGVVQQQQEQLARLMASTRPVQHGDHSQHENHSLVAVQHRDPSNAGASSAAGEIPDNSRNDVGAASTAGSHSFAASRPGDSTMHISSELSLAAQQLIRAANAALSPQRDNPKHLVESAAVESRTKVEAPPGPDASRPALGQEASSSPGRGNREESERMLWRTLVVGMQEQFLQVQQLVQVLHHQLCQQRQAVAASAAAASAATQQLVQLQVEHERLHEQLQAAVSEQQQLRQALWQARQLR